MRMLLVGDCHGNDRFFHKMCAAARDANCTKLVQLGDFGYWEHYKEGQNFLRWCEEQLDVFGIDGYWLDGNHENHPLLWRTYGPGGEKHKPTDQGFWEIRKRLYYMPRGHRWVWDEVTFLSLGGAYSIDKYLRLEGSSWWPEELITQADWRKAATGGHTDVLLTHDAPMGCIPYLVKEEDEVGLGRQDRYPESTSQRKFISALVDEVTPLFMAHGHYHARYSHRIGHPAGSVQIEGLGCDMDPDEETCFVFDTEAFRAALPHG